jgi:hypothetical protein
MPVLLTRFSGEPPQCSISRAQRLSGERETRCNSQMRGAWNFHVAIALISVLALGPHSCAGGSLIRMLAAIATAEFVHNVAALDVRRPIEWHGGSGFQSPKCLYVFLRQQG